MRYRSMLSLLCVALWSGHQGVAQDANSPIFWSESPPNLTPTGSMSAPEILIGSSEKGGAWQWSPKADDEIDLILLGDTNISLRSDPEHAFGSLIPTLKAADIVFVNLEGPFAGGTDNPSASDIPGKDWRHSNPDQVMALVAAGIDVVGIANNVTLPPDAMMRSLTVLQDAGLEWTGGGENIGAARRPAIMERGGVRVGFLQYTALYDLVSHSATENQAGVAPIRIDTLYQISNASRKPGRPLDTKLSIAPESVNALRSDLEQLTEASDIQIVSFHWGLSDQIALTGYEEDLAKLSIDAGADLVFGHGSHRLKPIDVYKGAPIIYDPGQGVFDDVRGQHSILGNRSQRYPEGLMMRVRANQDGIVAAEFAPIWRDTWGDDQIRIYKILSPIGRLVVYDLLFSIRAAWKRHPFVFKNSYVTIKGVGEHPRDQNTTKPDLQKRGF